MGHAECSGLKKVELVATIASGTGIMRVGKVSPAVSEIGSSDVSLVTRSRQSVMAGGQGEAAGGKAYPG